VSIEGVYVSAKGKILITIIIATFFSFGLLSCDGTTHELEPAGRWSYAFFNGYKSVPEWEYYADPEGGLVDAVNVNTALIDGKNYLLLEFHPRSGRNSSRVFIFDTENPLSPRLVSTIGPEQQGNNGVLLNSVAVAGNILYAGLFGDKGLWMADISNPSAPVDLGIAPLEMTSNLVVSGGNAYAVGQMYNGVSIADVTDTKNVREVARIDTVSRECRIAVSGSLLFTGIGRTLTVYDVSTPSSPKQVGTCDLAVSDNLVTELPFYQLGEIHWANWASIMDFQTSGNYVYVAFGAGQVRVVDVTTPSTPKEVATALTGGFAIALSLQNNLLYVTKSDKDSQKLQMSIVDISQPESTRLLDSVMTESVFGFGGASYSYCWIRPRVIGDYVYIAGANYLDIFKTK
jgi:hypothetical protein